jgi:hypothetical protein
MILHGQSKSLPSNSRVDGGFCVLIPKWMALIISLLVVGIATAGETPKWKESGSG